MRGRGKGPCKQTQRSVLLGTFGGTAGVPTKGEHPSSFHSVRAGHMANRALRAALAAHCPWHPEGCKRRVHSASVQTVRPRGHAGAAQLIVVCAAWWSDALSKQYTTRWQPSALRPPVRPSSTRAVPERERLDSLHGKNPLVFQLHTDLSGQARVHVPFMAKPYAGITPTAGSAYQWCFAALGTFNKHDNI